MQFDAQVETATLWYAGCCNLNMQCNFALTVSESFIIYAQKLKQIYIQNKIEKS